jgi:general secretion pathway protein G
MKNKLNKKAFTLMEIMIVIIILSLLAAFVLPNLTKKGEDAKKSIVCIQMQNIAQALKMYKIKNSSYPKTSEGLKVLDFEEGKLPKDSWKQDFIYTLVNKDKFDIISFGADKKEGGDDDIYYSKCSDQN